MLFSIVLLLIVNQSEAQRKRNRNKGRSKGRKGDQCHQKEAEKCLNKMVELGKGKDPTAIIATEAGINRICKYEDNYSES